MSHHIRELLCSQKSTYSPLRERGWSWLTLSVSPSVLQASCAFSPASLWPHDGLCTWLERAAISLTPTRWENEWVCAHGWGVVCPPKIASGNVLHMLVSAKGRWVHLAERSLPGRPGCCKPSRQAEKDGVSSAYVKWALF